MKAQIQNQLSPENFQKWVAIRKRINGFDSSPVVIKPLRAFDRSVLSATLYANASR